MRFACVNMIAPGENLAEQCAQIAGAGCQGLETIIFPGTPLEQWQGEVCRATADAGLELAVVIIGSLALAGREGLSWGLEALGAISEVGAAALVTAEYLAQDPLPLFPPFVAPGEEEQQRVNGATETLAAYAEAHGITLLCEPLTQFESRFWRDVESVVQLCERIGRPGLGVALDFHNMNITEADMAAAIARAGPWVRHVHLADNNRRLPGRGHIDFRAGFAALQAIRYDRWYTFECAVDGDFAASVQETIHKLIHLYSS